MNTSKTRGRVVRSDAASDSSRVPSHEFEVSAETPADKTTHSAHDERNRYEAGSWWSHAAYGLGTIALAAPVFIPGIPARGMTLTYLALGTTAIIALMVWGVIRQSRESWKNRRARR